MKSYVGSEPVSHDRAPLEAEPNVAVQDNLHPAVYAAIIGLALWLVVSAWVFFGGADYDGITLVVVTGLFVVAIGIPVLLWRTWQRRADHSDDAPVPSFRDWRSGEFATWTGRHAATGAAIETLLPIAAVAFGMTAIGLVFVLA
jgi:hypothetical protein